MFDDNGYPLTKSRVIAPNTSTEFSNYNVTVRNPYVTAAPHEVQFIYKKLGSIIPVDENGKHIGDAIQFKNDPTAPTKALPGIVPSISGYTPLYKHVGDQKVPTSVSDQVDPDPKDPGKNIEVIYRANAQTAKITYIDDTTKTNLDSKDANGKFGQTITFTTAPSDEIANYKKKGYVLVSNDFNGNKYQADNSKNVFHVHLKHGTVTVTTKNPQTPNTPINPDPQSPKYPKDINNTNHDVKRTIDYKYSDGKTAQPTVTDSLHFERTVVIDKVTGKVSSDTWTQSQNFSDIQTPAIQGYTPDRTAVSDKNIGHDHQDIIEHVVYNPDQQKAKVLFIDDTAKKTLDTHNLTGVTNGHESYSPSTEINQFVNKHYVLVSSDYPEKGFTYDNDDSQDQVFEIHLKHSTHAISDKKSITETITYKMSDDSKAPDKVEKQVEFSRVGKHDDVTNTDTWNAWQPNTQSFSKVPTPEVKGYTPDIKSVEAKTVTAGDKDITVTVTYNPNQQKAKVLFIDDTAKKTLATHDLTGVTNGYGSYNPSEEIEKFTKEHYVLVSSEHPEKGFTYDNDDSKDQVFEIHLKHGTHDISDKKSITETITYKMSDGSTAPDKVERKVEFNRVGKHNDVTNTDTWDEWQPGETPTFDAVLAPEVKGYTPDTKSVEAKTVTAGDKDITVTVTYNPDKQKAKVLFIDDTAKTTLDTHNLTGVTNGHENYNPSEEIDKFVHENYVLASSDYPAKGFTYDNDDSQEQVFNVHLKHGITTVTPDNPGRPGEPVDPNTPDSPKYPDGTDEYQVKRTGTQTIHYVGASDKTPADNNQTFIFTREITFDNVTGNIISVTPWNVQSHTFGNIDTPVIPGYHADKAVAGGATVTPDDLNRVITVTYAPDGNPGNPGDQPDSEISSDEHFENVKAKDKLDKTNPKKMDAYKKERKIIKTKIAKQDHTEIAEPKLPQTGEADNSIIGLLGMLLASFAAMFGFDSLHSHDKKHKN